MVNNMEPNGQVKDKSIDGNIFVPMGHYALSNNKHNPTNQSPNFVIYGLGSCIALILFDDIKKISAMSHILLPNVFTEKKYYYPINMQIYL